VCQDFLRVLQTDKPAKWGSFKNEKDWTHAMENSDFAQSFTAAMDCRGVYLGQAVAKALDCSGRKRLLDIAGGSGIYACSIASHHPHLSAAVFEKPPVDRVARKAISDRGCSEKVSVIAGDMFKTDLPGGFDFHLISNVLHDWDAPIVRLLLEKSFRALAPGGLLVIHDAHLNEGKSGPLPVASYSAMLMHSTEGKCYSLGELYPWLRSIGFQNPRFTPTAADRSIVTVEKPA
jgi:SAM-dependent methyltransferase